MPRPNPPRTLQSETNLARRIAHERDSRGMSYEGLADRMTKAGCPIQASAIYKIEKMNPPRRITVDELVGFAQVFEVSVEDLLTPVEIVRNEALRQQVQIVGDASAAVVDGARRFVAAWAVIVKMLDEQQVDGQVLEDALIEYTTVPEDIPPRVSKAITDLYNAVSAEVDS